VEVLVIDDVEAVASALHRLIRKIVPSGWEVFHTTDPVEARSLLVLDPRIRIAVVDILMPGLAGDALIEDAIRHRPDLRGRILVSSGIDYPPYLAERLFGELGCLRLDKPIEFEALESLVFRLV